MRASHAGRHHHGLRREGPGRFHRYLAGRALRHQQPARLYHGLFGLRPRLRHRAPGAQQCRLALALSCQRAAPHHRQCPVARTGGVPPSHRPDAARCRLRLPAPGNSGSSPRRGCLLHLSHDLPFPRREANRFAILSSPMAALVRVPARRSRPRPSQRRRGTPVEIVETTTPLPSGARNSGADRGAASIAAAMG